MKSILSALLALLLCINIKAQTPEMILTNGKIFTSDTARLYVQALAIKDGRIIAAGSTTEVEKMSISNTKKIDLKGMLVVPGFNDAHNHLPDGLKSTKINLPDMNPSWQILADSLKLLATRIPKGQWIEATIGLSVANSTEVNRFAIDKIVPEHPVRLLSFWGHVGIYNTLGMHKMGIAITQVDPKGGFYERLPDGKTLTGKSFEKMLTGPIHLTQTWSLCGMKKRWYKNSGP